jgi:hypothetical protein
MSKEESQKIQEQVEKYSKNFRAMGKISEAYLEAIAKAEDSVALEKIRKHLANERLVDELKKTITASLHAREYELMKLQREKIKKADADIEAEFEAAAAVEAEELEEEAPEEEEEPEEELEEESTGVSPSILNLVLTGDPRKAREKYAKELKHDIAQLKSDRKKLLDQRSILVRQVDQVLTDEQRSKGVSAHSNEADAIDAKIGELTAAIKAEESKLREVKNRIDFLKKLTPDQYALEVKKNK